MPWCVVELLFLLSFLFDFSSGTIDINLAEYQYLADHLTEKECHQLVSALHFRSFELPKDINAAERKRKWVQNFSISYDCQHYLRLFDQTSGYQVSLERRLPEDVPCVDLLLHWNSTPREGKGQTHIEVCHRLNQIGREDLAQWLSKTVFHELSKDLKVPLTAKTEETTPSLPNVTENPSVEITDEASWWKIDSFMEALIGLGLLAIFIGIITFCFFYYTRKSKSSKNHYTKLSSEEKY